MSDNDNGERPAPGQARGCNVALLGPMGSGKTTLAEALLHAAGATDRLGRVEAGTSLGDSSPEARLHRCSTEVNVSTLERPREGAPPFRLTLLDCPGSVELWGEAYHVLQGADAAVVVVEPAVDRLPALAPLLHALDEIDLPHVVVINKMDRSEARYRDLLDGLRRVSARPVLAQQYPIGRGDGLVGCIDLITEQAYRWNEGPAQPIELPEEYRERSLEARREMLETLADYDDALLEDLLEDRDPSAETVKADLRATLADDKVVPVFVAVAEKGMGVRRLLQALSDELPRRANRAERQGYAPDPSAPAKAQVLKTWHLPHSGKLSLARIWQGTVKEGMQLGGARVAGVARVQGGQHEAAEAGEAGDVVALLRMEAARTGEILGEDGAEPAAFGDGLNLQPVYALAIEATKRGDDVKLSAALAKLVEEDPSLSVEQAAETGETVLRGQGEFHLRLALERLVNRHGIELQSSQPRVAFRETIKNATSAHGRHKKQSGGHGQFADVKLDIQPLDAEAAPEQQMSFESKVVGGAVPKGYIPAVEAGVAEALRKGPLGHPVVGVAVTLTDGQHHAVDSSEMAFKTAAGLALKDGLPRCSPVLLEPTIKVTVSVPTEHTSAAMQILSGKRGQIQGCTAKEGWTGWDEVEACLPEVESHDLIVQLRSATHGCGFFTHRFERFAEVPERQAARLAEA